MLGLELNHVSKRGLWWMVARFLQMRSRRPLLLSYGHRNVIRHYNSQRNVKEDMSNVTLSSVPADGLAPWAAKTSADKVMTKVGLAIKGLDLKFYYLQRNPHIRWMNITISLVNIKLLVKPNINSCLISYILNIKYVACILIEKDGVLVNKYPNYSSHMH